MCVCVYACLVFWFLFLIDTKIDSAFNARQPNPHSNLYRISSLVVLARAGLVANHGAQNGNDMDELLGLQVRYYIGNVLVGIRSFFVEKLLVFAHNVAAKGSGGESTGLREAGFANGERLGACPFSPRAVSKAVSTILERLGA